MLSKRKSININGTSTVEVDGKETAVMTMNASLQEDGAVSCNKYIQNPAVYLANKEAADADYAAFEAYVDTMMEV